MDTDNWAGGLAFNSGPYYELMLYSEVEQRWIAKETQKKVGMVTLARCSSCPREVTDTARAAVTNGQASVPCTNLLGENHSSPWLQQNAKGLDEASMLHVHLCTGMSHAEWSLHP